VSSVDFSNALVKVLQLLNFTLAAEPLSEADPDRGVTDFGDNYLDRAEHIMLFESGNYLTLILVGGEEISTLP